MRIKNDYRTTIQKYFEALMAAKAEIKRLRTEIRNLREIQ